MKIQNKTIIFAMLTLFILTLSVACIYAEETTVGSLSFEVPDQLTVKDSTDTAITFNNGYCEIILDTTLKSEMDATDYLKEKGYSYDTTNSYTKTSYSASGSEELNYDYQEATYSGAAGLASAYLLDKDGETIVVIAIPDSSYSADSSTGISLVFETEGEGISQLLDNIMRE